MAFLTELWLPILLSAVFVFIASSILHMLIPIHKNDYRKVPGEDEILATMRSQNVAPGQYAFPFARTMKDMTPEMMGKYKAGPVGFMVVLPSGPPNMTKSLIIWFLYTVLIGIFVAYLGTIAVAPGAPFAAAFRVCGTVAVLVYAIDHIPNAIWKGDSWSSTFKFMFDGLVYGLITGATFAWMWPDAA